MNDTEWCLIALISLEAMSEERAQARSHASFNQIEATKINQCQWVIKWLVKCASEKHKIQLKLFFLCEEQCGKGHCKLIPLRFIYQFWNCHGYCLHVFCIVIKKSTLYNYRRSFSSHYTKQLIPLLHTFLYGNWHCKAQAKNKIALKKNRHTPPPPSSPRIKSNLIAHTIVSCNT